MAISSLTLSRVAGFPSRVNPNKKIRVAYVPVEDTALPGNDRHRALEEWLKAYRDGLLVKGSTLFCSNKIEGDFLLNNEHHRLPPSLEEAVKPISPNSPDFINPLNWWENNDINDGFDWNSEYIVVAIALGLIGRVIFVGGQLPNLPPQGRIIFVKQSFGTLDYFWMKSEDGLIGTIFYPESQAAEMVEKFNQKKRAGKDSGEAISIPYDVLGSASASNQPIPRSSILHLDPNFPEEDLEKLAKRFQPGVITILRGLKSFYVRWY